MSVVLTWIWKPPPRGRLRLPRWAFMAWLFHRRRAGAAAVPAA